MKQQKLIVFDLDRTLADIGAGILPADIEALKALERKGARIAICSGKPTYYLCGFMRQVGLERPILVGENGAVIQMGVDLPPRDFYILPYSNDAKKSIKLLQRALEEAMPWLWYQPNLVGLTPFPTGDKEFARIEALIEQNRQEIRDLDIYRHIDSFDIVPNSISKRAGLEYLAKLVHIDAAHTAAVGDGINDYPMFSYAGYRIGIGVAEPERVDDNVGTCAEALALLDKWLEA